MLAQFDQVICQKASKISVLEFTKALDDHRLLTEAHLDQAGLKSNYVDQLL